MSEEARASAIPWPPVLIAAALVAPLVASHVYPLTWPGLNDLPARIIGYGSGGAGLFLMAWGFVSLRLARTTIWPHRRTDRLVTEGAFRFRRNPIYMGEVLVCLGLAEVTHNIWFAVMSPLLAIGLLQLSILPEERHLEARFGEMYRAYKARTRRWF
jgi:protein-S-isoprenylcysteine O-methyltransferase Ste14